MPTRLAVTIRGYEFEVPSDAYLTQSESEQILALNGVDQALLRRRNGNLWAAMCKLTIVGIIKFDTICMRCNDAVSIRGKCHHQDPNHGWSRVVIRSTSIIEHFDEIMASDRKVLKAGPVKKDYRFLVEALKSE